jgi:hypothetical protein
MRYGAATRKRTRHGAERGRLTSCDAAPSRGEERRRRDSVRGDMIWHCDEETHDARRAARPAHELRRGVEHGRREAEKGGVSGDAVRSGKEETKRHSAWRGRLTSCDAAPSMGEERR